MNLRDLFIDKSKTLIVNTDLALVLGDLNEAIILNQLNYWLEINKKADKNFIDGNIGFITLTQSGEKMIFLIGVKKQYKEPSHGLKTKESSFLQIITRCALIKQSGIQ